MGGLYTGQMKGCANRLSKTCVVLEVSCRIDNNKVLHYDNPNLPVVTSTFLPSKDVDVVAYLATVMTFPT